MKCPHCQKEVPDNAKVCGYCGTRLLESIEPLQKKRGKTDKPEAHEKKADPRKKTEERRKAEKKAPHSDKVVEKTKPSRKQLPAWITPAVIGLAVFLAVAAYLFFFTSVFRGEQTYIPWQCEREYAHADDEIILYYTWTTLEKDQIAEYFNVADHRVSINDAPVKIKSEGFGRIEQDEQGFFVQMYWMKLGKFQPGQYRIHTITNIREAVFDGWDWFGPGSDLPFFDRECLLFVEE